MIPVQAFTFKKDSSKYNENNKSNHLLNYLQLYQGPPLPINPIRLAGTRQKYSARAMLHENKMMA